MHYIITDIHNDKNRFCEMLNVILFSQEDHLYILGDLFDRASYNPDPLGVYLTVLKLDERCTLIRGNHDTWLANYIMNYYSLPEKKRSELADYHYNSFRLLSERLSPRDMQELARFILSCPMQIEFTLNGQNYLFAHAMTSNPYKKKPEDYYLMGEELDSFYLEKGIEGYISFCGHTVTNNQFIWTNQRRNVYMCDCGCGFEGGRLGCFCLETKKEFYV